MVAKAMVCMSFSPRVVSNPHGSYFSHQFPCPTAADGNRSARVECLSHVYFSLKLFFQFHLILLLDVYIKVIIEEV